MKPILTLIFSFLCLYLFGQPAFKYGNANDNYSTIIRRDGSSVYILGQEDKNSTSFGTITKLDANTGNILWQKVLEFPSQINDMVFIPPQGPLQKTSLYIIGHTLPFDINNSSFLIQVNGETSAIECSNIFNQTGRESFRKIIRHPNAANPNFPYYISGTKGISGAAATVDKVTLINLRAGCTSGTNINFVKEYSFTNQLDLEFGRGMTALNDGSLLLMGNETANNLGMAVRLAGTGNMLNAVVYNKEMELLDAQELSNGNILFSGKVFNSGIESGVLMVTDIKLSLLGSAFENKNVLNYPKIESNFLGEHYLTAVYKPQQNTNTTTVPLVQRVSITGPLNNPSLSLLWSNGLEISNSNDVYRHPAIDVSITPEIVYTDGRSINGTNLDFTYAKASNNFLLRCTDSVVTFLRPLQMGFNNTEITNANTTLPTPTQANFVNTEWIKSDFCGEPCKLDFTISTTERECNNVLYNINLTSGTPPYNISWDFNCDGSIDANGTQAQYTFTTNGIHQLCVKVIDGEECLVEKTITITTAGDIEAPVINCQNITIQCNEDPNPNNVGFPTVSDNADPNPVLSGPSDIIAENTPCLKKIVRTWKAKDDCENESSCVQVITIKDEISPMITGCGRKIIVQGMKDANGKCKEKVGLLAPPVIDQCDANPSIINSINSTNNATTDYFEGTTIVTWTATDQCGNSAVCKDTIIVLGCDSTCCISQQEFKDRVENSINIVINPINVNPNIDCKAVVNFNGLFDCDKVLSIEWGDGNITMNPVIVNEMHQYIATGNYQITFKFEEKDGDKTCFNHIVKKEIVVNCCDGCRYNSPSSFSNLKLIYSNGWVFDLSTTGTVPRPPSGVTVNYSGNFKCFDSNACFHELFHNAKPSYSSYPTWTFSPTSSNFSIQLPTFIGNYNNITLNSFGSCWTAPAVTGFSTQCQGGDSFSFRNCDCDNQFKNDINQGFLILHQPNSCSKKFNPHRLSVCDRVKWKINGVVVANNQGYNAQVGPFVLNNGLNEVCMIVARPSSTTTCIDTFCQQIFCLSNPSFPNVPNSGLESDGNTGLLRDVGMKDWKSCEDNVFIQDDGYFDQGSLLFLGSKDKPATIVVDLKENKKSLSKIGFSLKQYFTEINNLNTQISIQSQSEICGGQVDVLKNILLSKSLKGWEQLDFELNGGQELPYQFLAIKVDTRDTFPPDFYKIDNICFEFSSKLDNLSENEFSVYPNPFSDHFTLDFKNENTAFNKAIIYDMHGRQLQQSFLSKGQSRYDMDLSDLSNGIYLLKVMKENGQSFNRKIVKVE